MADSNKPVQNEIIHKADIDFIIDAINKLLAVSPPCLWKGANQSAISGDAYAVCYGNNKFIAGGVNNSDSRYYEMAYSTDGLNWTAISQKVITLNSGGTICYGNGKFVAIQGDYNASSTDGTTWTPGSRMIADIGSDGVSPVLPGARISYGNEMFVVVGCVHVPDGPMSGGPPLMIPRAVLFSSTDGGTWTLRKTESFYTQYTSICYGNDKFVAGLDSGKISYSTDGINWTTTSSRILSGGITSLCYGNGKFIASGTSKQLAYSTDGINWTAISSNTTPANITSLCYGNGIYLVSGYTYYSSSRVNEMAYSRDGISWVPISSNILTGDINDICFGDGKFVAVGKNTNGICIMCSF